MNRMMDALRGTGRTTRMLQQALREAIGGRHVIVAGWRDHHCLTLLQHLWKLPEVQGREVQVNYTRREFRVNHGSILFLPAGPMSGFDWRAMKFRGMDPRTPVFMDHHTLEMHQEEEAARAANARRATQLAERRGQKSAQRDVFSRFASSNTPVVDGGTSTTVPCDIPGDASSSSTGSESGGGSCGAD